MEGIRLTSYQPDNNSQLQHNSGPQVRMQQMPNTNQLLGRPEYESVRVANNYNENVSFGQMGRSGAPDNYSQPGLIPAGNNRWLPSVNVAPLPAQAMYMPGQVPRYSDPFGPTYFPYMYGHDKWPYRVESAFTSALRLIIKNGTSKIKIKNKNYGRNELISIYIKYHTGETRTKKQISSHIQVWKKSILNKLSTNVRLTPLDKEILELIERGPNQTEDALRLFYSVFEKIIEACPKEDIEENPNVLSTSNVVKKDQYYQSEDRNVSSGQEINSPQRSVNNSNSCTPPKSNLDIKNMANSEPMSALSKNRTRSPYAHSSEYSGNDVGIEGDSKVASISYVSPGYMKAVQDNSAWSSNNTISPPGTTSNSVFSSTPTDSTTSVSINNRVAAHTQKVERDFIDAYDNHLPSSRDLRKGAEPFIAALRDDLGRGAVYTTYADNSMIQQAPAYTVISPQIGYQQQTNVAVSQPFDHQPGYNRSNTLPAYKGVPYDNLSQRVVSTSYPPVSNQYPQTSAYATATQQQPQQIGQHANLTQGQFYSAPLQYTERKIQPNNGFGMNNTTENRQLNPYGAGYNGASYPINSLKQEDVPANRLSISHQGSYPTSSLNAVLNKNNSGN